MLTSSVQSPPPPAGNTSVASVSTDVIPSGYTAIYSADDLNNVRNNLSGKYILMNDIDLSSIDNWEPIGNSSTPFAGTFDGNGHVIKNLKIDRASESYIGLFKQSNNATIKNLGLENVDVKGNINSSGLVGKATNSTFTNCYVTGNVNGTNYTGGLIGDLFGTSTVSNCYSEANVTGQVCVGGLLGRSISGSTDVSNCYSTGIVKGKQSVGGIVGYHNTGTISNCYTTCNVDGKNSTGLIIGKIGTSSKITNVWADKKNSTYSAFDEIDSSATIKNCAAIDHSEFTSHKFWDSQNLDSSVWEMSYSIPPVLKGVGGQKINWHFRESSNEFRLQVGSGTDPAANALFVNTGLDLGGINVDLSTIEGCLDASRCAKAALDAVAKRTADIGIEQSRLETISNVNTTQIENLSAAYSTVTEADVAEETLNYTKAQILASTTASLITQAQNFQANLLLRMINSLG